MFLKDPSCFVALKHSTESCCCFLGQQLRLSWAVSLKRRVFLWTWRQSIASFLLMSSIDWLLNERTLVWKEKALKGCLCTFFLFLIVDFLIDFLCWLDVSIGFALYVFSFLLCLCGCLFRVLVFWKGLCFRLFDLYWPLVKNRIFFSISSSRNLFDAGRWIQVLLSRLGFH